MSTHAVLYARFSPRPGAETCESVDKQLERCRAYCNGHAYDVVAQFSDKDLSGSRADNRPGLQRAIAAACRQRAVLCVYSLSRLARCTRDAIDLAERLNTAGADLAVIQENVNTRSPRRCRRQTLPTSSGALRPLLRRWVCRPTIRRLSLPGRRYSPHWNRSRTGFPRHSWPNCSSIRCASVRPGARSSTNSATATTAPSSTSGSSSAMPRSSTSSSTSPRRRSSPNRLPRPADTAARGRGSNNGTTSRHRELTRVQRRSLPTQSGHDDGAAISVTSAGVCAGAFDRQRREC